MQSQSQSKVLGLHWDEVGVVWPGESFTLENVDGLVDDKVTISTKLSLAASWKRSFTATGVFEYVVSTLSRYRGSPHALVQAACVAGARARNIQTFKQKPGRMHASGPDLNMRRGF